MTNYKFTSPVIVNSKFPQNFHVIFDWFANTLNMSVTLLDWQNHTTPEISTDNWSGNLKQANIPALRLIWKSRSVVS